MLVFGKVVDVFVSYKLEVIEKILFWFKLKPFHHILLKTIFQGPGDFSTFGLMQQKVKDSVTQKDGVVHIMDLKYVTLITAVLCYYTIDLI